MRSVSRHEKRHKDGSATVTIKTVEIYRMGAWIEWSGGISPLEPSVDLSNVEVRFRNGKTGIAKQRDGFWLHNGQREKPLAGGFDWDVMAYRFRG